MSIYPESVTRGIITRESSVLSMHTKKNNTNSSDTLKEGFNPVPHAVVTPIATSGTYTTSNVETEATIMYSNTDIIGSRGYADTTITNTAGTSFSGIIATINKPVYLTNAASGNNKSFTYNNNTYYKIQTPNNNTYTDVYIKDIDFTKCYILQWGVVLPPSVTNFYTLTSGTAILFPMATYTNAFSDAWQGLCKIYNNGWNSSTGTNAGTINGTLPTSITNIFTPINQDANLISAFADDTTGSGTISGSTTVQDMVQLYDTEIIVPNNATYNTLLARRASVYNNYFSNNALMNILDAAWQNQPNNDAIDDNGNYKFDANNPSPNVRDAQLADTKDTVLQYNSLYVMGAITAATCLVAGIAMGGSLFAPP